MNLLSRQRQVHFLNFFCYGLIKQFHEQRNIPTLWLDKHEITNRNWYINNDNLCWNWFEVRVTWDPRINSYWCGCSTPYKMQTYFSNVLMNHWKPFHTHEAINVPRFSMDMNELYFSFVIFIVRAFLFLVGFHTIFDRITLFKSFA